MVAAIQSAGCFMVKANGRIHRNGSPSRRHAIVLAGGEGTRLAAVAEQTYGYPRPKQFCQFGSEQTLLEETLARAERFTGRRAHIAVSVSRAHRAEVTECLADWPEVRRVEQPLAMDTTPGILIALLHVLAQDPDCTLVVLPSDHHVSDEEAFVAALLKASRVLEDDPNVVLLAGAQLAEPEPGLGWIVPGASHGRWKGVARFVEKPDDAEARSLVDAGALANTFVLVARGAALARLFREHVPDWWAELCASCFDTAAVERLYQRKGRSSFSKDVLAHAVDSLGVVALEGVHWSDIGTPERLFAMRGTPAAAPGRVKAPKVA